jgi:hypothetical protein
MKQLITRQPFVIKFLYVQSHSDDIKEWSACTIKERMNIKVNHLAKNGITPRTHDQQILQWPLSPQ